jgi:protein SCO1/2
MTLAGFHRAALAVLGLLVVTGCQPVQNFNGTVVDPPRELALKGTNWDGEPFDLSSQQGKVSVVFFGYTFCPDICPFALADMKTIYRELGDQAEDVSIVFVSVDPHRDSLEKLSRYVPNFDRRFYGLRLEFGELETVQEDFEVTVQYSQPKDGPGSDSFYYVDHTGTFFVFGRDGKLRLTYPPKTKAETMLPDIRALLS